MSRSRICKNICSINKQIIYRRDTEVAEKKYFDYYVFLIIYGKPAHIKNYL